MAVMTLTDARTLVDEGDATTGWSSPIAGESLSLITTLPEPVESTSSIGMVVSTQQSDIVHTITAVDLTSTLIYVWINSSAELDTIVNGGVGLIVGDVTNLTAYHIAGSDVATFRHSAGPVTWQCLVLDTGSTPTANFTALAGAETNMDFANITRIGAMYTTLSKALGNLENCFIDITRYGNEGLIIKEGAIGTPGTFSGIEALDNVVTDLGAFGIAHELGSGVYGLQGPLTFGDSVSTAPTYFLDTDTTVVFEARGFQTDKYFISIVGNATGETTFQLGTKVGTVGGSNGCSLSAAAGVGVTWTSTNTDLEFVLLYGSSFTGFEGGMTFSSDSGNAPNHEIFACTFSGNGQIDIGLTEFKNNNISAAVLATAELASVRITDTTNISDLAFTSGGTGHGILIDAVGTYTFADFAYTNFGADASNDASLYNNSGGAVTVNVSGGVAPTVRNGAGASTNIINTKSIDFHVEDSDGNGVDNAQVYIQKSTPTAQFAGDEYNQVGLGFLVVSSSVDLDIPTTGTLSIYDKSENATLPYRYISVDADRLTFPAEHTGTTDTAGTSTQLLDNSGVDFTTDGNILEGDTIQNTTDNSWAVVDQIISATELLTSPLRNGSDNTWSSGDGYSVNTLATTLQSNIDTVDIPLVNAQTKSDASGDINTISFSLGSSIPISIRIRSNEGATKYIPFITSATITDNFSGSAVIQEDPVAT